VTHYWKKRLFTDESFERVPLDLPEIHLRTEAIWIDLPEELTNKLIGSGFDLAGTIHATEHASIGILPLIALCDRNDIGGVSHPTHPYTDGRAAIFIYDGHAGGVGIARTAFESIEELLAATLRTIEDCECEDGCPSCVQSPKCGNNNEPLDKAGAAFLLRELLVQSEQTEPTSRPENSEEKHNAQNAPPDEPTDTQAGPTEETTHTPSDRATPEDPFSDQ
jgi:DEAD/DEAH box helicase domain-containing protein